MQTAISLVEDNAVVSASLQKVIAESQDFKCVSTSRDAEHALRIIPRHKPDVVLMDIELPGISGIECTDRLKQLLPDVRILILTVYKDSDQIFKALKAGANGYLLKRSSADEILRAIRDVKEGGAPMSAEIAAKVVQSFHKPTTAATPALQSLTPREAEVLGLLAQGYVSKEIADKLSISYETVRTFLGNIYEKLHVRSRTEAVIKYFQK
ncbi:MAG TPA: response regulator transcription factor [Opitutaceae bacterium]|nr:response regulator transcription factor [Opitutaceae bacterium]